MKNIITKIILIFLLFSGFGSSFSQGKINASYKIEGTASKMKAGNYITEFFKVGDNIFILYKKTAGKSKLTLKKYTNEMQFISEVELKSQLKEESRIHLIQLKEKLIVVSKLDDKESRVIKIRELNAENLKLGKPIELLKLKKGKDITGYFSFYTNNDKLILKYKDFSKKRKKYISEDFMMIDDKLSVLWTKGLDENKNEFSPDSEAVVNKNGDIYYVSFKKDKEKNIEKMYINSINSKGANLIKTELEINDKRIVDYKLVLNGDKIFLAGIFKNSKNIFFTRSYVFNSSLERTAEFSKEITTKMFIEGEGNKAEKFELRNKKENKAMLGDYYYISDFIIKDNNEMYMIIESFNSSLISYDNSAGQTTSTSNWFYFNSIFVTSMSSKGEILNIDKICKSQTYRLKGFSLERDKIPHLSYGVFTKNNNLYFVFNERDPYDKKKVNMASSFEKISVVSLNRLKQNGDLDKKILFNNSQNSGTSFPRYNFLNKNGDFVFFIKSKKEDKTCTIKLK